jgi:phosphoglycolate phosphatase-like HAD superfamily hydrolase
MNNSYDRASSPFAIKIIFDIDGTLANNSHRLHYITGGKKKNWEGFRAELENDVPNSPVVTLLRAMKTLGYRIIISTGRFEESRTRTEKWLRKHLIFYHDLFMRPNGDFRPDYEVKEDMLRDMQIGRDNILFVVDDRDSVVEMWRRNGLTVLQCAKGDF